MELLRSTGHAVTDVLCDLLMKVAVTRREATGKRATIPCQSEGHDPQCPLAHSGTTMA